MSREKLNAFIETDLGLSPEAIGPKAITKAIDAHRSHSDCEKCGEYLSRLRASEVAREAFISEVVVPETWFFRNRKSFDFMIRYVQTEWQSAHKHGPLRILSVPCSSGEEPYSVAMALIDSGFPEARLRIDGMDINAKLIEKAKRAVYGNASFRGQNLAFRTRYFEPQGDNYALVPRIKETVRFVKGNMLRQPFPGRESAYDIILCRNLLIYMSLSGKEATFRVIKRILTKDGLLFLGHAERQIALAHGFIFIHRPGVFACRKDRRKANREQPAASPGLHRPRQRVFEKAGKQLLSAVPRSFTRTITVNAEMRPDEMGPESSENEALLFDRVQQLADEGSLPSACQLCQNFLNQNPTHIQANFLMGLIYEALNENNRAEEFFNKTIYLDPAHHNALTHLAFILEQQGDEDKAAHLRKRANRICAKQNTGHV